MVLVDQLWMADHFTLEEAAESALDQFKRAVAQEVDSIEKYMDGKDAFIKEVDRRAAGWRADKAGATDGC